MNNNLISLSLSGSKTSSLSETSKVANNIINLNLSNVNHVSSLESNFQSNLVELQLTEKEYTFEELMEQAEKSLKDMEFASEVEKIINEIGDIDPSDISKIKKAQSIYNDLSYEQKKYVSDEALEKLVQAEKDYNRAINKSKELVNAVNCIDKLGSNSISEILSIMRLYNSLTDSEKKFLNPETLSLIETYDEELKELQNSGGFSDLTDKQYNMFARLAGRYATPSYESDFFTGNNIGTLSTEYSILDGFEVVDSIKGENGFSALVLKDKSGDYTIVYPSTASNLENYLYDAYPLLVEFGIYDMDLTLEGVMTILRYLLGDTVEILKDFDDASDLLEYVKNIYETQRKQASDVASKYYELANSEDVCLNFFGHSKGGGMSEFAYLECLDKYENDEVLGKIVIYNPFHDDLNQSEVDKLKQTNDLTVYRNQGDFVSMVFNEADFDEETIFLKVDWEDRYGDAGTDWFTEKGWAISDTWSVVKNFDGFVKIFSAGPHGPASASAAFDEQGNALPAEKVGYSTVSEKLFGVEDVIGVAKDSTWAIGAFAGLAEVGYYTPARIFYDGIADYDNIGDVVNQLGADSVLFGEKVYDHSSDYGSALYDDYERAKHNFNNGSGIFTTGFNFLYDVGCDTIDYGADLALDTFDYGLNIIETGAEATWDGLCTAWDCTTDWISSWF